jgi:hypothetical protein
MCKLLTFYLVLLAVVVGTCFAGNKDTKHAHDGVLGVFSGTPIAVPSLSPSDQAKLDNGDPVCCTSLNSLYID